jgi:hypothetical protein
LRTQQSTPAPAFAFPDLRGLRCLRAATPGPLGTHLAGTGTSCPRQCLGLSLLPHGARHPRSTIVLYNAQHPHHALMPFGDPGSTLSPVSPRQSVSGKRPAIFSERGEGGSQPS